MELSKEQKEKLKNKLIQFSEDLMSIIKNKGIDLSIPLVSNYNSYGGLVLKIHNNYFGYTTNKTRFITIYDITDNEQSDSVYSRWRYKNDFISEPADLYGIISNKVRELTNEIFNDLKALKQ